MPFGSFFSKQFSNRGRSKKEALETKTKVQVDQEPNENSDDMNIPPLGKENNSHSTVPKKMMEASDLLSKHARGRENVIDAVSSTGRRSSGEMKYSSISSPPTSTIRVPSARTITNQCFPSAEEEPSSTPSPEVSYDEDFESYTLDSKEASPKSKAIMEEMNRIYQSAPMPENYHTSAPKKLPVLPKILLIPTQMTASKEKTDVSVGVVTRTRNNNETSVTKIEEAKTAYGKFRRNSSIPRQVSSADKGSGGKSNGATSRRNHRNSSAPSVSRGISESRPSSSPPPSKLTTIASKKQPTPLTVLREEEQRNQRAKDALSSSNDKDGRRNLDKRTARLRFADAFKQDIMQNRQRQPFLNNGTNHSGIIGGQIQDRGLNGVSIAVRKRPLFDYELDRGDFDVVSIDNTSEKSRDLTIVHNCVMHADMRRMFIKPTSYPVTAAFDEHCSDDDVFRHIAEPLVNEACLNNVSTILMYGQTGCGKSHTMAGIEKRMASTIFSKCGGESKGGRIVISLTFVELCGNKINDLLIKGSSGVKVLDIKVLDLDDGTVRLLNASVIEVKSPEELLDQILLAKGRRATEATDMNGVSSRSHAVCQIEIKSKHPSSNNRGLLTLIDCAGSERSHDSLYHSSERQKESAEINASLYALKECIRAKSKNARIPFRSSNLTRILKESFERDGARLCVIACVAPNATDTEHTMETLKTASTVVGVDDQIKEELAHEVVLQQRTMKEVALPPSAWDHQQLKAFLTKNKLERVVLLTQKHDGKLLMKMSVLQMRAQLFDDKDKEFAQTLFDLLRKENDRVAVIQRNERVNNKLNRKGGV